MINFSLGDRHGENILFDEITGECLHVDLNCLFEKGLDFEIPEKVPFRLTHNMVDALGIYGTEGPFKKCSEVSMAVLQRNKELLMSVLETFLHDPLCEWSRNKARKLLPDGSGCNPLAVKSLTTIERKLQGYVHATRLPMSTSGQVEYLIQQATDPENLSRMYIGWASFL
jgi:serine/threonine-protein kinase ATR